MMHTESGSSATAAAALIREALESLLHGFTPPTASRVLKARGRHDALSRGWTIPVSCGSSVSTGARTQACIGVDGQIRAAFVVCARFVRVFVCMHASQPTPID